MKELLEVSSTMRRRGLALTYAVATIFVSGCTTMPMPRDPFGERWKEKRANDLEIVREDGARTIPILGKGEKAKAAIVVDEEGKAKLRVGKFKGVQVNMDVRHGEPEASVGYRIKFGGKKKPNPKPQKPSPFD